MDLPLRPCQLERTQELWSATMYSVLILHSIVSARDKIHLALQAGKGLGRERRRRHLLAEEKMESNRDVMGVLLHFFVFLSASSRGEAWQHISQREPCFPSRRRLLKYNRPRPHTAPSAPTAAHSFATSRMSIADRKCAPWRGGNGGTLYSVLLFRILSASVR